MISIAIDQQRISVLGAAPFVATDSIEFAVFHFEFSDDWDGYTKAAQFTQRDASGVLHTYNQLLTDNECYLPAEIAEGNFIVSVFGTRGGAQRATSGHLCLNAVHPGMMSGGETPIPPTPDLYAQYVALVEATCIDLNARADLQGGILGAAQTVTLNADGSVAGVVHKVNGETVRTDVLTYSGATVTEVRTLATGQSMTVVTDTDALSVSITWSDGA